MRKVQEALSALIATGVPVMAGIWRATSADQSPPVQYVVYSSTTKEDAHNDDHVKGTKTFVYMNLWSDTDPTETADTIRRLMYAAGFFMIEESDKGYNQPAYDAPTRQYTVQWTWVWHEEVDYGS